MQFSPGVSCVVTRVHCDNEGTVTGIDRATPPYPTLTSSECDQMCVGGASFMQSHPICAFQTSWHDTYSLERR